MQIHLRQVALIKYKRIQKPQSVEIGPSITIIVRMNLSGKTSFVLAIHKTTYFNHNLHI